MPAPSIHLQGWDRNDHKRRIRRLHLQALVLLFGALIGVGTALVLLRRLPAPAECTAVPEPLVHRKMQPAPPATQRLLAPLGPVFSGGQ